MKDTVVISSIAVMLSLASTIFYQVAQERNEASSSRSHSNREIAGNKQVIESPATSDSEILAIQARLSRIEGLLTKQSVNMSHSRLSSLMERIEATENAVAKLSSEGQHSKDEHGKEFQNFIGGYQRDSELTASSSINTAEMDFEADSGIPLAEFTNSIETALHNADGIDTFGMDCRTSICKVDYSKVEPLSSADRSAGAVELVDTLALALDGREVEIRYGKDSLGKDVMYIQLR